MNWITIIWSMVASACLTLAAMNLLVWHRKRTAWSNLLISLMAAGTAVTAFCELSMMLAPTPAAFGRAMQWTHLPLWVVTVSLVLFIRQYLRAGRPWLAWSVIGLRTIALVLNFIFTPNIHYREITSLEHLPFLGESVSVARGVPNPWMLVAQTSTLLLVIYVIDAMHAIRQRADQRRAFVLSVGIVFFVTASMVQTALVFWGHVSMPITVSFFSLGVVAVIANEMSRDVHRSAQLAHDLGESEARFRDITYSMGDWVWEVDEKGVYTYSSAKGTELFGRVIGKTPFDLMTPEEAERVGALFCGIAAAKAPIRDLENWNVAKDGTKICLLTNGVPILDQAGNLRGYRGVDKDITGRKHVEEALEKSRQQIAAVMNSTNDWIWSVDPDRFGLLTWNGFLADHFSRRSGLEISVGMTPWDLLPPDRAVRWDEMYTRALRDGSYTTEYDVTNQTNILLLSINVMKQGGRVFGISVFGKDITDLKRAETARREGLERYKAVVEGFDGYIYICSEEYRVEYMNKPLIQRTGRNAVGELCYKALHDKESVCEWCVNEKVFQGETVRWEVQSPKDLRWYYVVNTPINHTDGTMSKQAMIMDITERKQAEEALKANEVELRNSKKDLHRLAGRLISAQEEELRRLSRELHDDLTQRLAVLAIEAGKLELDLDRSPGTGPESIRRISQIKDHLIKVSEDVHTISRQLHPTILDDLGLARAIESECAAVMGRHPITIVFRKENVPDEISDDIALCLYRVVQEGLRNITAHSEAKDCEIFLKGMDHTLCLAVCDDGRGFDPVEVRSMPGLGLSSMRERVQLARGEFSIRSQPGKGTEINVCVPLSGGDA